MRANHSTSRSRVHVRGGGYRRVAWAMTLLLPASCLALVLPGPAQTGNVLVLTKTGPASASVGDTITYTFKATNNEIMTPLLGAKVTDPLFGAGWSKDLGTLNPGQTKNFTQKYTVTSTDPDPLKNTAFAQVHSPQGDYLYDKSAWTTKVPGLFGHQFPNASTRNGYQTYYGSINVGTESSGYTITYHGTDGQAWGQTITVAPGARGTFTVHDTPDMPAGDYSAIIESDQPVVVSQSTIGDYQGMGNRDYGTNGI